VSNKRESLQKQGGIGKKRKRNLLGQREKEMLKGEAPPLKNPGYLSRFISNEKGDS